MAARYLVPGGTGNWNSTTNWSATDGGASGASFPIAGDDVHITLLSGSPNINVNVASACATLTVINSYAGTLTLTNTLTLSSTLTLGTGMTIAGSGTLSVNGTCTLTSAGKTIPTLVFGGSTATTITLADNIIANNLTYSNTAAGTSVTVNNNKITVNGNLTVLAAGGRVATGTSDIELVGTGTWQMGTGTSYLRNNLTIKSGANITLNALSTNGVGYDTGTLTIENGATVGMFAGSTLRFNNNVTYVGINNMVIETLATPGNNPVVTTDSKIIAKIFNCNTNVTFTGSDGTFEFDQMNIGTANPGVGRTITLKAGATYQINTSIDTPSAADLGRSIIQSSSSGNKAYIDIPSSATQKLSNMNMTDIEATTGTLWVYNGTITNCTNVKQLQHYQPTIGTVK